MNAKSQSSGVQIGQIKISPLAYAIILIALWAIIRAGFGAFFKDFFGGELKLFPTIEFTLFSVLCFVLGGIGIIYFGLIRLGRVSWQRLGWTKRQLRRSVLLGIIGFVVGIGIMILVNTLVSSNDLSAQLWALDTRKILLGAFWGFAIAVWIEQNLFAGYIQPILIERWGAWLGIIIQAVLFSGAHIGWMTSWPEFLNAFIFGLVFGVQRGYNRSIVAPYLTHALMWVLIGAAT